MPTEEIVVQASVPPSVAQRLRATSLKGVDLEPPRGGKEQTTRFGLAEMALVLAVCAGVEKVVKLALEIRELLRNNREADAEKEKARLTTPDGRLHLDISGDESIDDIIEAIDEVLKE